MPSESELHVVLGGSGAIGSAVVRELASRGLRVRAVNRTGKIPYLPQSVDIRVGEAVVVESLRAACDGATTLYHCMHPHRDLGLLAPMTRNVASVAAELGAKLVAAQSVFLYGRVSGPIAEDTPVDPADPVGRAHAKAASILTQAHESGAVPVTIGRAAHAYGSYLRRFWCGLDPFAAVEGKPAVVYGDVDTEHSYIYVDDFARALVTLSLDDRAYGRVWHLPAAPTRTTRQLLTMLYEEAGHPLALRHRSWALLRLASTVSREQALIRTLLYQFTVPYVVDSSLFESQFDTVPTNHEVALKQTVAWCRRLSAGAS